MFILPVISTRLNESRSGTRLKLIQKTKARFIDTINLAKCTTGWCPDKAWEEIYFEEEI